MKYAIFIVLLLSSCTPQPLPIPKESIVVCDGNSLTYGYMASDPATKSYPARLKTMITATVINTGISGQTTLNMIENCKDVDTCFKPDKLNILVAWEIGNHIYFYDKAPQDYYDAFVQYCKERKSANPSVQILAVTMPFRDNSKITGEGYDQAGYAAKRNAVNAMLRSGWKSFADGLVDLENDPLFKTYNTTYYVPDMVHLNDAGYDRVAQMVATEIKKLK